MKKTIVYLNEFRISKLVLDKEYIDYNMSENYDNWSDFIESELRRETNRCVSHMSWSKDSIPVVICKRPFVWGIYKKTNLLQRYLGYINYEHKLVTWEFDTDREHKKYYDFGTVLYDSFEFRCHTLALDLQNRGLKTILKKVNSKYTFQIANQMLKDKCEELELCESK